MIDRYIDRYIGGLIHGLIRTAHAVRGTSESGARPAETEELACGLAYWAAVYRQLPLLAECDVPADPEEAISQHSSRFARFLFTEGSHEGVRLIQSIVPPPKCSSVGLSPARRDEGQAQSRCFR